MGPSNDDFLISAATSHETAAATALLPIEDEEVLDVLEVPILLDEDMEEKGFHVRGW